MGGNGPPGPAGVKVSVLHLTVLLPVLTCILKLLKLLPFRTKS